jgi:branched-chain amino acid transport system substrate-binding protein
MERKFWFRVVLVLAVLAALVYAQPVLSKSAPRSIKIGTVLSLSGKFAAFGENCKNAYEILTDKLNAEGGIYIKEFGKKIPVELRILDDESDGLKNIFQLEVANEWGAVANLGGIGCTSFEIGTAVCQKNQMVWIGPGCAGWTPHKRENNYLFSTYFKEPFLCPLVFDMIDTMPEPRPKKVAIFEINQLDCQEAREFWIERAKKGDYKVVYHQKYPVGTSDFSAMITGAKAAGAEISLAYPIPPKGPAIVKQIKELDWNPKICYWVRAPEAETFSKVLGPLADYMTVPAAWSPRLRLSGCEELNAEHKKRYGRLPESATGSAYAAAQLLVDAIERAGTLGRTAIRDALRTADLETVAGRIRFHGEGWAIDRLILVLQFQNGDPVPYIVHYNKPGERYKDQIPIVPLRW